MPTGTIYQIYSLHFFNSMHNVALHCQVNCVHSKDAQKQLLISKNVLKLITVILSLTSVDKPFSATIQLKAIEQSFPVMLFITLSKGILTFESVDETFTCYRSIESY